MVRLSALKVSSVLPDRVLTVVLVLGVAWAGSLAARGVWLWVEPAPVMTAQVDWNQQAPATGNGGPGARALAEQVAASHWFGEPGAEPSEPEPVAEVEMPETRLQLRLRGVVAREDPTLGSALIGGEGRSSEYFRVGDTLFGQAELVEVHGNRVILRRSGELETLSFEQDLPGGNGAQGPATASRSGQGSGQADTPRASTSRTLGTPADAQSDSRRSSAASSSASNPSGGSAQQRLEEELRQAMQEVQARAQSDPGGLLRQYGLEPSDNGYRVTSRAGVLIANGLRPGDRITEINDQPVGNIDRDQQLVDAVLASDQIKITLERAGSTYRFYQSLPSF